MSRDDSGGNDLPAIGVVTVTYNSEAVLPVFLSSIRRQDYPENRLRVYAIDNSSDDATLKMLRASPSLAVVANSKNIGFAAASNQGIRMALDAGCDYIMLINNDTSFGPEVFSSLVHLAASEPGSVIVAPRIAYSDSASVWYAGGTVRPWRGMTARHFTESGSAPARVVPISFATGCCFLAHRSVFLKVGFLDEDYFVYCEDLDFCLRAGRLGVPILYGDNVVIDHKPGSLTGGPTSTFVTRQRAKNQVLVVRKNTTGAQKLVGLIYLQLWIIGRSLIRRDPIRMLWIRERAYVQGLSQRLSAPPQAPLGAG